MGELLIILHIEEGIGFNLKNDPILIKATLGGQSLESKVVTAGTKTIFDTDLIWDTDKKSVKRMKTENLPLKIECYSINTKSSQTIREYIGYIIIPIRVIPILPPNKAINSTQHWHKLIGIQTQWKQLKPELLMFLTITDKQSFTATDGSFCFDPKLADNLEYLPVESPRCDMLASQQGIYVELLQDKGLFQVGEYDSNCDIFVVTILLMEAKNLEILLTPCDPRDLNFILQYTLLGNPGKSILKQNNEGNYEIREKVVINFRSSLKMLQEYFNKIFYIPIDCYYDDTIVGHSKMSFKNIIQHDNLDDFLKEYSANNDTFESFEYCSITSLKEKEINTDENPLIEFIFLIKHFSNPDISDPISETSETHQTEVIENKGDGDCSYRKNNELPPTIIDIQQSIIDETLKSPNRQKSDSVIEINSARKELCTFIKPTVTLSEPLIKSQRNFEIKDIIKLDDTREKLIRKTFNFTLVLTAIKFNRRPDSGIWQISFHHSKADTPYTIVNVEITEIISELIDFNKLSLQLYFSSVVDDILEIVESEPCLLTINGPRGLYARAELDNGSLLVGTNERKVGIILMENQTGENIGVAHVYVYLDDMGINFNSQTKKYIQTIAPPKPYLDETLAYKVVEELENWKEYQQETFLVELKRKEIAHLAHLSTEWQNKRIEQETKLSQKLETCTKLTAALEEAQKNLKDKGIEQYNQERFLVQAKGELEKSYSVSMMNLKEKTRRLEADMEHQAKLHEMKCKELELDKKILEKENNELKKEKIILEERINELNQNLLPKEQVAELFQDLKILNEKLETVENSKKFYKEQWARIIREVHQMKIQNSKQIDCELQRNKNLGLLDVLESERSNLYSERNELRSISENLFNFSDN